MDSHNTHGWIIVALLREMSGAVWQGHVSMRGKQFRFQSMLETRKRGSPTLVAKDGNTDTGLCGGKLDEAKRRGSYGY